MGAPKFKQDANAIIRKARTAKKLLGQRGSYVTILQSELDCSILAVCLNPIAVEKELTRRREENIPGFDRIACISMEVLS